MYTYTAVGGVLSLRFKARSSSSVASAIEVDLFLRNPYYTCCLVGCCFQFMRRVALAGLGSPKRQVRCNFHILTSKTPLNLNPLTSWVRPCKLGLYILDLNMGL